MEEHKVQDAEAMKREETREDDGEPETAESTEDANPMDNVSEMEVDDESFPPGSLKFEHSGTEGNSETPLAADDENIRVEYYTDNSNSDNQVILHIDEEEIRRVVCAEQNQVSDVDLEVREEIIILDTLPDDAADPSENNSDALNLSKDLASTEEIGEDNGQPATKSVDEDESIDSREQSSEITLVMPTVEVESERETLETKELEDEKINVEIETVAISSEEIDRELTSDCSRAVETVVSTSVDEYVLGQSKNLNVASCELKSNEGANGSTENLRTANDVTNKISDKATTAVTTKEGSVKSSESRSMVQEIVDEWVEENNEEIDGKINADESHDLVEIELKTLLAEDKPAESGTTKEEPETRDLPGQAKAEKSKAENDISAKERLNGSQKITVAKDRKTNATGDEGSAKKKMDPSLPVPDYIPPHLLGRTLNNPESDAMGSKYKPQTPRPGVKVPGRHLTSQIASTAEVTKVLKERIKQKHKEFDSPQGGDILFVKKITQRLSSKLSSIPTHPLPELIPLSKPVQSSSENHSDGQTTNEIVDSAKIVETVDNRELLAILEGDVDPDWSNLKPHSLVEASKVAEPEVESAAPQKLDPVVERELALKQLLELPSIPLKKNSAKKKRTFKPAPSKLSVTNSPVLNAMIRDGGKGGRSADVVDADETKPTLSSEDDEEIDGKLDNSNVRIKVEIGDGENAERRVLQTEESRSGRKRKPTERAREHEQNTSNKKQKVYKGKVASEKRTYQAKVAKGVSRSLPEPRKIEEEEEEEKVEEEEKEKEEQQQEEEDAVAPKSEEAGSGERTQPAEPAKSRLPSRSKTTPSLGKKISPHMGKRNNMSVKKLIRQKPSSSSSSNGDGRKTVGLKSRYISSPKKMRGTIKRKLPKRLINISSGDINFSSVRPKKKTNEIDKLLQDEGVVNLLYDVEQPDQKRLVPITKSQTKVMDLHKVQRELRMRTKMVRNAVLRLNTSTGGVTPTKMSPRSKRAVSQATTDVQQTKEHRQDQEPAKSSRTSAMSSPTDFVLPAKIRNAADASVIIRRHSASSYSSTSGSPRVSIDGPEKSTDDGPAHVTRSTRRRHSQNRQSVEANSSKKHNPSKKRPVETGGGDSEEDASFETEVGGGGGGGGGGVVVVNRSNSRVEGSNKSTEKTSKSSPPNDKCRPSGVASGSKITTRSNGTLPSKGGVAKSKKGTKTKIVSNKTNNEADDSAHDEAGGEEDELSACLAEAVSALSGVDGGAVDRSGGGNLQQLDRKSKAANATETVDNSWTDSLKELTTSGEMNFRRCGNLVQIILTPSSTVLNNGITLELMHELREALAVLRKDDGCRVVLVTSTGSSFCEGLDLSSLLLENKEDRRARAEEMALGLKEFIKSLANFNKPIVAGVQGPAVGLGVTILPLFDLIIASDKATFGTPYGQLGQIPEGAAIFTLSQTIGNTVISELLLGGKTITASEALRAGLVTRVLWPDRFQAELLPPLQAMSEQSSQSMEATKTLLRHNLRKKLDAALESESYVLIQHWCSAECQALIKSYLEGKDRQGNA